MFNFSRKIGIDLGSFSVICFSPNKEIYLNERSIVSYDVASRKIIAVGSESSDMIGKLPPNIKLLNVLNLGVIQDYKSAETLIKYCIKKAPGPSFIKPEIIISVPDDISSSDSRALLKVAKNSGVLNAYLAKESLLAFVGSHIEIEKPTGQMMINIGSSKSSASIISLGSLVVTKSINIGGDKINLDLIKLLKHRFKLEIGEQTAEFLKKNILSFTKVESEKKEVIKGKCLLTGLPKKINIQTNDLIDATIETLQGLEILIKKTLSQSPAEISADILDNKIYLSGGSCLIDNLTEALCSKFKMKFSLVEKPIFAVALGAGIFLEKIDFYKKNFSTTILSE